MPTTPRDVIIRPVLNGWKVTVGCQQLVFENLNTMANALVDYYTDPEKTEKIYLERKKNNTMANVLAQEACEPNRPRPDLERALINQVTPPQTSMENIGQRIG